MAHHRCALVGRLLFLLLCGAMMQTEVAAAASQSNDRLEALPKTRWRVSLRTTSGLGRGLYQYGQPVIAGDHIIAGSSFGGVFAIDPNGKPLWKFATVGPVYAPVRVVDGMVYVADAKGTVYALHEASGAEAWRVQIQSEVMARPLLVDRTLYVVSMSGELIAIDAHSGVLKWRTPERLVVAPYTVKGAADPIFLEGAIIVGEADGQLVAHRPHDGTLLWERRVASRNAVLEDVDTTPLPQGHAVLTCSMGGGLGAVEAKTGRPLWAVNVASPNDLVLADDGTIFAAGGGTVYSIDTKFGAPHWKTPLPESEVAAPVVVGDKLVTISTTGMLYLLDRHSGALLARRPLGAGTYGRLTANGNRIYLMTNTANLVALEMP